MVERSESERRELSLGPEHFEVGKGGKVIVKSKALERALEAAELKPGRGEDVARGDVSVGVVVSRSF